MAFVLRHHDRYPIFGSIRYEVLLREEFRAGYGTVTNVSNRGWRVYGNVPVAVGDVCSLKVRLKTRQWVSVTAGIVRWVQGEECGIETVVMNDESTKQLDEFLEERVKAL